MKLKEMKFGIKYKMVYGMLWMNTVKKIDNSVIEDSLNIGFGNEIELFDYDTILKILNSNVNNVIGLYVDEKCTGYKITKNCNKTVCLWRDPKQMIDIIVTDDSYVDDIVEVIHDTQMNNINKVRFLDNKKVYQNDIVKHVTEYYEVESRTNDLSKKGLYLDTLYTHAISDKDYFAQFLLTIFHSFHNPKELKENAVKSNTFDKIKNMEFDYNDIEVIFKGNPLELKMINDLYNLSTWEK